MLCCVIILYYRFIALVYYECCYRKTPVIRTDSSGKPSTGLSFDNCLVKKNYCHTYRPIFPDLTRLIPPYYIRRSSDGLQISKKHLVIDTHEQVNFLIIFYKNLFFLVYSRFHISHPHFVCY